MSILDLYASKKTAYGIDNPTTYKDKIFEMERTGINDLVAKEVTDPNFKDPSSGDTYIASLFKDGAPSLNL